MTIAGWISFFAIALIVAIYAIFMSIGPQKAKTKVLIWVVAAVIIVGAFTGFRWYFTNTASGQRKLIDQQSNLGNGLERTITVYTANGDTIAQYTGKIDIEAADGGYIKFDFDGKRYIYYNCFVESIAEIGG